ncbi:PEGA domain-containing protein [candidate division GN15 bacterium]|nr:PEGA domain-containing protein [candidate division GN15 bacterium]
MLLKRTLATVLICSILPVLIAAQTPSGSVTISSNPGGAEVKLEGEATVAGVTPTTFRHMLIGKYDVTVKKRGYETHHTSVVLDPTQQTRLDIELSPKTRWKAAARSMFIPGWGQHYGEQHGKAWLLHVLAAGSIVGYLVADHNFDIKYEKYERRLDEYDAAVASGAGRDELERRLNALVDAQETAFDHEDYRRISIGAVVGVWGLSVLDALLFFPDERAAISVKGVDVEPSADFNQIGLTLSYSF